MVIRSPIPARPANVSADAPILTPRRAISTMPRVMSAAFALSPKPRPSQAPAAMAITFLIAPAISTPTRSRLVYTLNRSVIRRRWASIALGACAEAATTVVGISRATSSAWLGPESAATRTPGTSPPITSDIRIRVSVSIPFDALMTSGPPAPLLRGRSGANLRHTPRRWCEGTAATITPRPPTASSREAVILNPPGIGMPGRNLALTRLLLRNCT